MSLGRCSFGNIPLSRFPPKGKASWSLLWLITTRGWLDSAGWAPVVSLQQSVHRQQVSLAPMNASANAWLLAGWGQVRSEADSACLRTFTLRSSLVLVLGCYEFKGLAKTLCCTPLRVCSTTSSQEPLDFGHCESHARGCFASVHSARALFPRRHVNGCFFGLGQFNWPTADVGKLGHMPMSTGGPHPFRLVGRVALVA